MSNAATAIFKDKAKRFLQKLLDDDNPSPQPTNQHAAANDQDNMIHAFNALSVSSNAPPPPYQPNAGLGFVGGFHPVVTNAAPYHGDNRPPSFPSYPVATSSGSQLPANSAYGSPPMSLTMQHALRPSSNHPVSGPLYASAPPMATVSPPASSPSPTAPPAPSKSKPSTPSKTKPKRSRAESDPLKPGNPGQVQCSGITKAGKRCTRMVKIAVQIADDEDDEDASQQEHFCHQHSKELLLPSGYYARKNGEWVKFEDWIPEYLQQDTQVALRVEMEKARTQSDVPGYIYTFEIREDSPSETIKLKVGRAVNLVKRIDQWGKQCGSKEQILRGWYPGTVEDGQDSSDVSLMKGRVKAGEKAAWCHRLERLIHIELTDLAANSTHLNPGWPRPRMTDDDADKRSSGTSIGNNKPCADCGAMHKEIFEFKRWEKGKNKGKEWELIVRPVIERWVYKVLPTKVGHLSPPHVMVSLRALSTTLLTLGPIAGTWAAHINVTVGGPGLLRFDPEFVNANAGDIIHFTFLQKNHTVTQSTFESPCVPLQDGFDTGFVPVPDTMLTAFPIAQLPIVDSEPIWVFCRQANHCRQGMVFAVNPGNRFPDFKAAATGISAPLPGQPNLPPSSSSPIPTVIPPPQPSVITVTETATVSGLPVTTTYASMVSPPSASSSVSTDHKVIVGGAAGLVYEPSRIAAQPGDTVTFEFKQKNHTVTQSSFANPCRALSLTSTTGEIGFDSGFMPVAANALLFPTFTIQINDTRPIWAYCRQVGHCGQGMVFSINADDTGPESFTAFQERAIQLNGTAAESESSDNSALMRSDLSISGIILTLFAVVWVLLL
ncbi:hypothetical protein AX16_003676 [Volvariella volvacea WC 439]|nr:hypothetical protein AX16_003676 [Volvariella volvacea WC 439]